MDGSVTGLEQALRSEGVGEIQFDAFARGRYATDASSYQIMPLGVVIPGSIDEATRALSVARSRRVPVLARGGGTSQSGQTVNAALVVDCSKRLTGMLSLDTRGRRCRVEPGMVLDELNRRLKPTGLWFPVDISTASRATIGGMTGNNSCGGRSLRYGTMRDNVLSIDAVLADGSPAHFGAVQADLSDLAADDPRRPLSGDVLRIGAREADEVAARFPAVQRRVGGYNLDALTPPGGQSSGSVNLAHLLVGSEGTLAFSTAIELRLSPLLGRRAVGVCHFGSLFEAMDAAQHIVALKPIAIELVDQTMIGLAAEIPVFKPTLSAFLCGAPAALLVVEFADNDDENRKRLSNLKQLIGDLGFGWDRQGKKWGGVVASPAPSRCATTTANAGSSPAARCAPRIA
jgi:FAD/FMN-containing dehydrogenase